jgi:hypothetical protein
MTSIETQIYLLKPLPDSVVCNISSGINAINNLENGNYYIDIIDTLGKELFLKNESIPEIVIIDLYNVYCSFVMYYKYKTFSTKSFYRCLWHICEKFSSCKQINIVSKPVYESGGIEKILEFLKTFKNVTFYSIKTNFSENRERDDFFYLHLYYCLQITYLNHDIRILTNDNHRNFTSLVTSIKPFSITKINKDVNLIIDYDNLDIEAMKSFIFTHMAIPINRLKFYVV